MAKFQRLVGKLQAVPFSFWAVAAVAAILTFHHIGLSSRLDAIEYQLWDLESEHSSVLDEIHGLSRKIDVLSGEVEEVGYSVDGLRYR